VQVNPVFQRLRFGNSLKEHAGSLGSELSMTT
jgi:hypothetical protein